MRTFKVEIKKDGTWHNVNAVFPFSSGELLDERLDEAYVTFYDSTKAYKPTTEFQITHYMNGTSEGTEYYILASDNSAEYPAGSGRYKHQVYLIERTKLLEGVVCPSLTFTNSYKEIIKQTITIEKEVHSGSTVERPPVLWSGDVGYTIPETGANYYVESPYTIADYYCNNGGGSNMSDFKDASTCSIAVYSDGKLIPNVVTQNSATVTVYQSSVTNTTGTTLHLGKSSGGAGSNDTSGIQGLTGMVADRILLKYTLEFSMSNSTSLGEYIKVDITYDIPVDNPKKVYLPNYNNITDYILRILEEAEPLQKGQDPRFTFDGVTYTNGIASGYAEGSQAEKYSNSKMPPEFSLTQATLREQLKTIGSYIHAEPYLDENNVVHFIEYGRNSSATVPSVYISNTATWDINQYCTDVRSNAQNLISSLGYAKGVITEPGSNLYRAIQSETVYQRIEASNGICATDKPIYEIVDIKCGVTTANGSGYIYEPESITEYVYEQTIYDSQLSSVDAIYPNSKAYALYYTQGQQSIRGLFYQHPVATGTAPYAISYILAKVNERSVSTVNNYLVNSSGLFRLVFQVTYKAIGSAFVSHGKQEYVVGETPFSKIYNQSDNLVETEYYGENIKGVAARLGNIDQERTYVLKDRSKIPSVGDMIDGYAISAVSSEYMPYYIKCTVGLTKDFNRISEYIGINSMKRMYEISERQTQRRDILIKEVALITTNANATSDSGVLFNKFLDGIRDVFRHTETRIAPKVDYVKLTLYDKDLNNINGYSMALPCMGVALGNTISFSFGARDNYAVGAKSEYIELDNVEGGSITGRWSTEVPYVDSRGGAFYAGIGLYGAPSTPSVDTAFSLPIDNFTDGAEIATGYDYSRGGAPHRLRKDNREIISYTLELELKADSSVLNSPDLIIGSELAARCGYINSEYSGQLMIWGTDVRPNKYGLYFESSQGDVSTGFQYSNIQNGIKIHLDIEATQPILSKNYWVITTSIDGGSPRIILAGSVTTQMKTDKYLNIYFVTKKT